MTRSPRVDRSGLKEQMKIRPSLGRLARRPRTHVLFVEGFSWHGLLMAPLLPLLAKWATSESIDLQAIAQGWRPTLSPDLIVMCDAGMASWMRELFPEATIVHVGHGLISKNQTAYHYADPDYICVASDFVAARLTERGHVPRKGFLATGLMQTDPLFAGLAQRNRQRQTASGVTITYAPTWNPTLSSAEMIGPDVLTRVWGTADEVRILIKPHPHTPTSNPEWISMWQEEAARSPQVQLVDPGADLIPILLESDLMVSDASSAIFHFLALDRPIVLIDNPDRFSNLECFDPDGIEWTWRDIGSRVEVMEDLSRTVRQALVDPQARGVARRQRRSQLFGELTDGQAAGRIDAALKQIAMSRS